MASSSNNEPAKHVGHQAVSQSQPHQSQEEWISEEELYTEGSSDEDDMALRIKKRESKEAKERKLLCRSQFTHRSTRESVQLSDECEKFSVICDADRLPDQDKWRPIPGKLKMIYSEQSGKSSEEAIASESQDGDDPGAEREEGLDEMTTSTSSSLSEAYSNMHKLDALLRDSDRRLKEAQAETLRAQLATRAQLRTLREQADAADGPSMVLAKNWDAFMQLCPVTPVGLADAMLPALHPPGGVRGLEAVGSDAGPDHSILPRISGVSSDHDESDSSDSSDSALAITDEEKLKLTALLRDLEQDVRAGGGYHLDADARRSLDHIDCKLQELAPEEVLPGARRAQGLDQGVQAQGLAMGATRQQRLEDIDRCLQALAESALGDVEPVDETEVRALLEEARGGGGRAGEGDGGDGGAGSAADPALISDLLAEARKELPRFRYRHRLDADEDVKQKVVGR